MPEFKESVCSLPRSRRCASVQGRPEMLQKVVWVTSENDQTWSLPFPQSTGPLNCIGLTAELSMTLISAGGDIVASFCFDTGARLDVTSSTSDVWSLDQSKKMKRKILFNVKQAIKKKQNQDRLKPSLNSVL